MYFSHQIQPLQRRRTNMWTYLGPSCLDRPSSEELGAVEVEVQIHKVLDHRVNLTPGAGPIPYGEGSLVSGLVLYAPFR
jgi:hypothetical protein